MMSVSTVSCYLFAPKYLVRFSDGRIIRPLDEIVRRNGEPTKILAARVCHNAALVISCLNFILLVASHQWFIYNNKTHFHRTCEAFSRDSRNFS
jgi:hypothetical protein